MAVTPCRKGGNVRSSQFYICTLACIWDLFLRINLFVFVEYLQIIISFKGNTISQYVSLLNPA